MDLRALIIEDEENLVGLLRGYLEREGFEVSEAVDGEAGIEVARSLEPDVVVLDWMLPKMDGLEVLRELRRFSEAYVIMLTARAEEGDKIVGLSAGADDYLTKPFSPGELVARVRAMLRRPCAGTPGPQEEERIFRSGGLEIDPDRRLVRLAGEEVALTALEFDLLLALASRPGFVFGRRRLLEHVRMEQRPIGWLQEKATPLWKHVAGGCHLDRDTLALVREAGFAVERVERHLDGLVLTVCARNPRG